MESVTKWMFGLASIVVSILLLAFLAAIGYLLRNYTESLGQLLFGFILVSALSLMGLIMTGAWQAGRLIKAWVDRHVIHSKVITHGDVAVIETEANQFYPMSAIHQSAAISTYALELENDQKRLEAAFSDRPNNDSEDTKMATIQNLLTQGASEDKIAKALGISRTKLNKDYGHMLPKNTKGVQIA